MGHADVAVIGGGLAGMIAAIALARTGRKAALVAPAASADRRTTALMEQSVRFLERLALWEKIRPSAAALTTMQIVDGTNRLLRAPTVAFRSSDIGLDAFGYNMPNQVLLEILNAAAAAEGNLSLYEATATKIDIAKGGVTVTLNNGEMIEADFVVGADGRRSCVREAAAIGTKSWSYPQSAMVLNFSHTLPHRNVSTEFHTESGPFTQVPLPGNRSSLVWVQRPEEAAENIEKPLDVLSRLVEGRMQSLLGAVTVEEGAQLWPLSGMTARHFGKGRCALIGEAAHVFPPIGAQGLNLGLRDIMSLSNLLGSRADQRIEASAGDRFDRKRRLDIISRTASVDLLNRSLLSDFLPAQFFRMAGLHLLSVVPPLRNLVMHEGIEPGAGLRAFPSALREMMRL
jgi:2-octaprenyl-6-methoxyphenol hydroxylase